MEGEIERIRRFDSLGATCAPRFNHVPVWHDFRLGSAVCDANPFSVARIWKEYYLDDTSIRTEKGRLRSIPEKALEM
jgi:hypothetical protein